MPTKITSAAIKRAHPRAKPYEIRGQNRLILRVQPSGRKTYYVLIRRGVRERIGDAEIMTLARAEYRAREILNESEDHGRALKRDPIKSTLGGFIEAVYTPWLRANRRRAEKTLLDLKRCFEDLYRKRLTDLTRSDLDTYVAARRSDDRSAATIVRDLNNLQGVLRLAIERGYVRDSIFKGWRKPKVEDRGVTRYLDPDEEKWLRDALQGRDKLVRDARENANKWREERQYEPLPEIPKDGFSDHLTPMVLVSLNTGLRYGELTALDWSAVDLRLHNLTVAGHTAKGAKTRHIPLNLEALDVLQRWRDQTGGSGLVFANRDGSRIGTVKTAWQQILRDAKVENFRWHDLRHTFASKLVQKGVDLAVVRELLGHGDFALTLRYAHLEPKQKAEAVARLSA